MALQSPLDRQAILARLDAILHEVETLRQLVEEPSSPEASKPGETGTSMTDALWGAAGQGNREEYDLDLDWKRFDG